MSDSERLAGGVQHAGDRFGVAPPHGGEVLLLQVERLVAFPRDERVDMPLPLPVVVVENLALGRETEYGQVARPRASTPATAGREPCGQMRSKLAKHC